MESLHMASHIVGRLKDTGLFTKVDYDDNDPVVAGRHKNYSPLYRSAWAMMYSCDYNEDRDEFITRIGDEIC